MPDSIEKDRQRLRRAQARKVMPMIGPLLDAWDGLPNDVRSLDELTQLGGHLNAIAAAMETVDD